MFYQYHHNYGQGIPLEPPIQFGLKLHMRFYDVEEPSNSQTALHPSSTSLTFDMTQSRKTYSCEVCHRDFLTPGTLSWHLHAHKQRPSCDKAPMQSIHEPRGEALHKCDICFKEFRFSSYLRLHRKLHTREKPYQCAVCHKLFTTAFCLTSHMKTHTDAKPYQCNICYKKFVRLSTLTGHKTAHSPFQCHLCGSRLTTKRRLNGHMLRLH